MTAGSGQRVALQPPPTGDPYSRQSTLHRAETPQSTSPAQPPLEASEQREGNQGDSGAQHPPNVPVEDRRFHRERGDGGRGAQHQKQVKEVGSDHIANGQVRLAAHGGDAPYPSGTSDYHHEVELVVAIGKQGHEIAQADALSHIYGYGVGLDMTRRDLQEVAKDKRRPWCISKDVEAGAILGPLTKASDFGVPAAQQISLMKNGEIVQQSDLSLMVYDVPELLAHLSCYYTLMPGDIIMTGTPEGVGPVVSGDHLVGKVEGLAPIEARFRKS